MKLRAICIAFFCLVGCATTRDVTFHATSSPVKASIDVDGVTVCESTPCQFYLRCAERWVGLMNSPTGRAPTSGTYTVVAVPTEAYKENNVYSSTRTIDPCRVLEGKQPELLFRLDLEPVAPTQKIRLH